LSLIFSSHFPSLSAAFQYFPGPGKRPYHFIDGGGSAIQCGVEVGKQTLIIYADEAQSETDPEPPRGGSQVCQDTAEMISPLW
ncbi:hypothetical protein DRJ12_03840, partial [Candidatus Acetothermia bacterium]